jgi:hypothetical protein
MGGLTLTQVIAGFGIVLAVLVAPQPSLLWAADRRLERR